MNNFLEQLEGLGRFGSDAYESGVRARENREKIRKILFDVKDYATARIAREMLEHYIHEFGNPQKVPDLFFDDLDETLRFIKALEDYADKNGDEIVDNGERKAISNLVSIHCDEFRKTASKILRLAFTEKEPPMVLPKPEHFRSQKENPIDKIFGD